MSIYESRPWLQSYPSGIPANIDPNEYVSVVDVLLETMHKYKKLTAFSNMGVGMTYKELDKHSRNFGAYLSSRGLKPGDKIAIMMPNLLQYPIAIFGAMRAGLIVVNTSPLYTPREMKHQFTDSGVKAVIISTNYAYNLQQIIDDTDIETVILTELGEMLGGIKGALVNFVVKNVKKMVPKFSLKNTVKFKEALKSGMKFELPGVKRSAEDVIMIQYTGGTTGVAKGAELTNRNVVSNMLQIRSALGKWLEEGKEVALSPLPMYHIFAFTVHCLTLGGIGAHSVLVTNPRDLKSVIKEFKNNKLTLMTGVNTLFNALLNHPDFAALDFSNLKISVGGGMAVQKPVAEKWKEVTGCTLTEGYGLTETSPLLSVNPPDAGKLGTIGIPAPSTWMRIVDDKGNVLPQGEAGEIQAKGPQVMKGYYNRPEETANVMDGEWFCTGDIGFMDEDGFFKIVDRKKDMILVSGFNVYPNELEEVIAGHPKVLEVAAIGVPDERTTEAVKIFVVKKDNSLNEKELRAFCAENFTGYKKPKHIEFIDELPKTNVGKILRRALREQ